MRHPEEQKVAVFGIDSKRGVWTCDPKFCPTRAEGPLHGPPAAWVGAWWKHLREDHNTEEQEMR